MSNNTLKHISDESKYVVFNPEGSSFPSTVNNVQSALSALKPIAVNGVPEATIATSGLIRIATQAEVDSGNSTNTAVTPATLKERLGNPQASETVLGLTKYATSAESQAGTINNKAVVPTGLKASIDNAFDTITSTETRLGTIKLSTVAAAQAGTDDTTAMTPKKVQLAIAKATAVLPVYGPATESVLGTVRIATNGQVAQGTLKDGYAISPSGLASLTANMDRAGIARAANPSEVSEGISTTSYVSPATLTSRQGGVGRIGLVKLIKTAMVGGDANTALAYDADVLNLRGGQTVAGNTNFVGNVSAGSMNTNSLYIGGRQAATVDMIKDSVPVGTIIMWPGPNNPDPNVWAACDGRWLNAASYPTLFSVIGRIYGGSGNSFALPDMGGLFVRGIGKSAAMVNASGNDSKGKPGLGAGCGGAGLGQISPQTVRFHKHDSGYGERWARGNARNGCSVRYGYVGSKGSDQDNYAYFTNDGTEIEPDNIRDSWGTMNSEGLIGYENKPWSIAMFYLIKIR